MKTPAQKLAELFREAEHFDEWRYQVRKEDGKLYRIPLKDAAKVFSTTPFLGKTRLHLPTGTIKDVSKQELCLIKTIAKMWQQHCG